MTHIRFRRGIYRAILGLHPAPFQDRFSQEMLWIFDETVAHVGLRRLIADALSSLLRQWAATDTAPRLASSSSHAAPALDDVTQSSRNWMSWGVPLVVGFLFSTAAVALLVPPRSNSLTWPALLGHSAGLLLLAAAVALAGIWMLHRIFDDYLGTRPATAVLACAWSAAIWLPLLLLLRSEHALWVIAAPLPIAVIVTRFTRRQLHGMAEPPAEVASKQQVLFASVAALRPTRVAWIALLAALLLQALITATAIQAYATAESVTILLAAVLVWGFSGRTEANLTSETRWRRGSVLPCFLLTSLALTPFLRSTLQSVAFRQVVLAGVNPVVVHKIVPGMTYTGFILTAPPLSKHLRIDPPGRPSALSTGLRKEQIIPFDGVYWFYEADMKRPGPDAPVHRGDPLTSTIRSISFVPLSMEAHQRLGTHIAGDCCGGFTVDVRDADNRVGTIAVEAILRDTSAPAKPAHSLGSVIIRASQERKISLYRPPVDERLRFSLRSLPSGFRFNEVTLLIRPSSERNLAGARVKIKDFALEP